MAPSYQLNNRSLDSLITGLQSLQQCKFDSILTNFKTLLKVPVSDGEYTVQVAEDTDIPLDGSASFLNRESETIPPLQHDSMSDFSSSHNSSTIFLP